MAQTRAGKDSAAKKDKPPAAAQRKSQLEAEQRGLQQRLAGLKKELAAAEASHTEVTDALRASEAAISGVNRRLRELAQSRAALERQVAELQARGRTAVARQTEQEQQLGVVLRTQFAIARTSPWQKLIDGESPGQIGRDLVYLDYIARAQTQGIAELRTRRAELADLEVQARDHERELAAIADDERDNRAQLVQQQTLRKQTLERLSKQIGARRQSIATVERDERRLGNLIEQLAKALADESRRRSEKSAATAAAPPASAPSRSTPAMPEIEVPANSILGRQRGKLTLPVRGEVIARFGAPRRTEAGVDAPTWKGVFIRAEAGADVHAVASGRVIFADWLRGFGNLLILDHGEGFISVYGNNATLLRNVGERVGNGDVIAEAGNTGGNAEPGLYFELRYLGRPLDPLRWAASR